MTNLPDNPVAAVIVVAIFILFGGGAGGAILALRKDRRQADREEVDLTELVKKVAADTIKELSERVTKLQAELDTVRQQSARDMQQERMRAGAELTSISVRLNRRIAQLEDAIRALPGGQVPPWPEDEFSSGGTA